MELEIMILSYVFKVSKYNLFLLPSVATRKLQIFKYMIIYDLKGYDRFDCW